MVGRFLGGQGLEEARGGVVGDASLSLDSRGVGSLFLGLAQACILRKGGPLSGALKGRASLLGLNSSAKKVQEGCVLLVRESKGGGSFGGSVGRRGQGTTSDEEPKVELPHGPNVFFLCDEASEPFPMDSLSSRVANY